LKKAIIVFSLSLVILLVLSGCATAYIMAMDNRRLVKAVEENWSDELKQFAKEEGLYPDEYAPGYIIPILGDAVGTYILGRVLSTPQEDWPVFGSDTNDGIAGLIMLTSSGIALFTNIFLYPLPPNYINESYYELTRKVKERLKAKRLFESNPNACPIKIVDAWVESDELFGSDLKIKVQNISKKTITAFQVKIYGYNAFGEKVFVDILSDSISGLAQNIRLEPFETSIFSFFTLRTLIAKINVEVIRVLFEDGTNPCSF